MIDAQTAATLREEVAAQAVFSAGRTLAGRLGMMGAVLLAAGVLMFVSANWEAMSRLARFALLVATLWGALLGGVALRRRGHGWLAEGVLLLAAVLFGAGIWLVAQSYHLHGNYLDAIFLWAAGALLVGLLLNGQKATVLGLGLLGYWGIASVEVYSSLPQWVFLLLWGAAALMIWRNDWRYATHVALLALVAWLLMHGLLLQSVLPSVLPGFWAVLGAALFVAGMWLARAVPERTALANIISAHGAAYAVLSVLITQHVDTLSSFLVFLLISGNESGVLATSPTLLVPLMVVLLGWALWRGLISTIDGLALAVAFACAALLPLWLPPGFQGAPVYWLLAIVVLLLAVWLVATGMRLDRPRLARIGYAIFVLEILLLYVRAFGGLLQTSLLFFGGGVLFILLALAYMRLHRRISVKGQENAP